MQCSTKNWVNGHTGETASSRQIEAMIETYASLCDGGDETNFRRQLAQKGWIDPELRKNARESLQKNASIAQGYRPQTFVGARTTPLSEVNPAHNLCAAIDEVDWMYDGQL